MGATRGDLHRIAVHVLGRRRFAVSGHFGLRASPRGFATPAFGPEPEVVRVAGPNLIREVGAESRSMPMDGSTLSRLAAFAEADLASDYSAGPDAPAAGRSDEPLHLDVAELDAVYGWMDLGWRVLDAVTSDDQRSGWSTIQLWPEHFDLATACDLGSGRGVNLGFSPGDSFSDEPYAYVGPWTAERPGEPGYWNASFGAVAPRSSLAGAADYAAFLDKGLELLGRPKSV